MIGHVYIKGLIGSFEDEQGVTLQDVVMQMEAKKDAEIIHVHINSPGGCVDTGKAIATYLSKQSNVFTIAEDLCGSIATQIHLSVPLSNRKILAGSEYFIHNPLIEGVSGNSKELAEASAYLAPYEREMVAMYCKATGTDKAAIEGLMDAETSLSDEEAKTLGFVSEILLRLELKAVAFRNENINKNKLDMSTIKEQIAEGLAEVVAMIKGDNKVVAMMVMTDNGELSYASEGMLPEVGEAVTMDGEIAPEGSYVAEDGTTIVVDAEGNVAEVVAMDSEEPVEDEVEALKAKISELEASAVLHAEALVAKEDEFKSELETQVEALKSELKDFKATVGSTHEPKAEKKVFSKAKVDLSPKEQMAERKTKMKAHKTK